VLNILYYLICDVITYYLKPLAPEKIRKWGQRSGVKWGTPVCRRAGKIFLVVPLHFLGSKGTISCFAERIRDDQYSLVSFVFTVLLTMHPCPAICKSGGHVRAPRTPMESTPLFEVAIRGKPTHLIKACLKTRKKIYGYEINLYINLHLKGRLDIEFTAC